ncbi:hypothetical protein HHK36_020124 [Tetracentron sinense]|uniref:Prephenate/arogenate dehydrogenase domain-containing protein n=1 Tax=Tetracentron sinense TaxID=13715 RepID=A0A834YYX9_TETSI|nr:hypothetical protein HHK36_020124 [Tetracentron sinense]
MESKVPRFDSAKNMPVGKGLAAPCNSTSEDLVLPLPGRFVWSELGTGKSTEGEDSRSQQIPVEVVQASGCGSEAISPGDDLEKILKSTCYEGLEPLSKEGNELSQSVSVVRDTFEDELSSPLEEGDSLEDRDDQFFDAENYQEGSSDEEGLWRMQGAEPEMEEASFVELEKCVTSSTAMEVEEGSLKRKEILANVAKSVEVGKVLGLRFAGGEEQARDFFADLEYREEKRPGGQGGRGGGGLKRRLDVRGLLRKIKPNLIAIQETKLEVVNDSVVSEVWDNRQVDWVFVALVGASSEQLVMWDCLVHEKVEDALTAIKGGRIPPPGSLPSFEEIKETLGFNTYYEEEKRYATSTSQSALQRGYLAAGSNAYTIQRRTQVDTEQRGQSSQDPVVEVITPEVYSNYGAYGSRGPFNGIWSRTLRVKITGRDGFEKIDVRIPAGFLDGITNIVPALGGVNIKELLDDAAEEVGGKMLLDFNDTIGPYPPSAKKFSFENPSVALLISRVQIYAAQPYDYGAQIYNRFEKSTKLKIAVVGFGNFGQFLAQTLVQQGHTILAHSRSDAARKLGVSFFSNPDDLCEEHPEVILLCTWIISTESILKSLPVQRLKRNTLFVDVLYVKEFPRNLVENTSGDSFDLYYGLFMYNKNAMEQLERLDMAFESLKKQLFGHLHDVLSMDVRFEICCRRRM